MIHETNFSTRVSLNDYVTWSVYLNANRRPVPRSTGARLLQLAGWFLVGLFAVILYDKALDYILKQSLLDCEGEFPKIELFALEMAPLWLAAISYSLYIKWGLASIMERQWRSFILTAGGEAAEQEVRWSIQDDHILVDTVDSATTLRWTGVKNAIETDAYFYLVTFFATAYVIAKRDLSTEHLETLRASLREKGYLTPK